MLAQADHAEASSSESKFKPTVFEDLEEGESEIVAELVEVLR